ncbi:MAG: hypothetical protein J6O41_07720 [Clostridia bacterium]|nr:hypothetical protein [Clostridia bacterium]
MKLFDVIKIGDSLFRVPLRGKNKGRLRYMGTTHGVVHKSSKVDDGEGIFALCVLVGVCYGLYLVFMFWYSFAAMRSNDLFMPSADMSSFYQDGLKYRSEEFSSQFMLKNQIASWEQLGIENNEQTGFQCEIEDIDSDILKKCQVNDFDLWYKTEHYSIIQNIVRIDTRFYQNGKRIKNRNGQDILVQQYFLVRSKIKYKRNFFVEYQLKPEYILMIYSNYGDSDLNNILNNFI